MNIIKTESILFSDKELNALELIYTCAERLEEQAENPEIRDTAHRLMLDILCIRDFSD